jgi:hypothetical protein
VKIPACAYNFSRKAHTRWGGGNPRAVGRSALQGDAGGFVAVMLFRSAVKLKKA